MMVDIEKFSLINKLLEEEYVVREKLKPALNSLQQSLRRLEIEERKVHVNPSLNWKSVSETLQKEILNGLKPCLAALKEEFKDLKASTNNVDVNSFMQYSFLWQSSIRDAVFHVSYANYLRNDKLIDLEELSKLLEFEVEAEDYLFGISTISSELARVCVNCVISKDMKTPYAISNFVNELYAAFKILNIKNDSLRKRMDSIKYDNQKIEDVIFDISIRGLKKDDGNNNINNNDDNGGDDEDDVKKRKLDKLQ